MRKLRDSKIPDEALLTPIDVTKFGSDDDPCFGKLYSLTETECMHCGDNEFCAIVFANSAHKKRIDYETKHAVLDVDMDKLELVKDVKDFNKKLIAKEFGSMLRFRRMRQRFRITNEQIKTFLNGR